MAIQTPQILKTYFEKNDKPTAAQFSDLIDTTTANNLKTLSYTIGIAGTTGTNHNFTAPGDVVEQSIQLGGTTIIPANSKPLQITVKCVTGVVSDPPGVTGTVDVGRTSGSNNYISAQAVDVTDEMVILQTGTEAVATTFSSATSVWFSFTPSVNWNTLTAGKWKIWISFLDNSTN